MSTPTESTSPSPTTTTRASRRAAKLAGCQALLVDAQELSLLAGVSVKSIRRWDAEGLIPGRTKLPGGRSIRWNRAAVLAWIESGCQSKKR